MQISGSQKYKNIHHLKRIITLRLFKKSNFLIFWRAIGHLFLYLPLLWIILLTTPCHTCPPSGASSRVGEFSRLGDDYGFARITSAAALTDFMSRSFRISGFTIILCKSGVMEIEINASPYTVSGGMLIVVSPAASSRSRRWMPVILICVCSWCLQPSSMILLST